MRNLVQDFRYGLRQLRKTPGFAITVVLTLALGIGANTAVFSVMNTVLLRLLPVRAPEQLFYLTHEQMPPGAGDTGDDKFSVGINVYRQLRRDRSTFEDVIAFVPLAIGNTAVRYGSIPEEARGEMMSGNFFTGLGAGMALGHGFGPDDEEKHSTVVVLSYGYWTRRFQQDKSILGQTLYVKGVPCTVIGVTTPRFYGVDTNGTPTDFWIPLQNRPELSAWGLNTKLYESPNWWSLMLMVRLRPGISEQQAVARMAPLFENAAYETIGGKKPGAPNLGLGFLPAKGLGATASYYEKPVHMLMGMVAVVLFITCLNIALLLVARNLARQREFALRLALGAGRISLLRQLLMESAVLVMGATALGWLFALVGTRLLARWANLEVSLTPDSRVLVFTLVVATLTTVLFALAPLPIILRTPPGPALKGVGTSVTPRKMLAARIAMAVQIALGVSLLFCAILGQRTLKNYLSEDLGMAADQLLVFGIHPMGTHSAGESFDFYQTMVKRLRALPGVKGVTLASSRPGSGWSDNNDWSLDGHYFPWNDGKGALRSNTVAPGFFQTMGIPILAGRDFTESDAEHGQPVAVVNETLAKRYLNGQNPIGHFLGDSKHPITIVGVANDSKYVSTDEDARPMAWYCYSREFVPSGMTVEVRTSGSPMSLLPEASRVLRELNSDVPLEKPTTQALQFQESFAMQRLFGRLAAFFGALAALLVAVGLYGTAAYRVNRRTVEIGVRMALGSRRESVLWMVLKESLQLVGLGLLLGLPLTFIGSKLMGAMIYRVSPHDPISFLLSGLGVVSVSAVAGFIPAHRAASIDPMESLRNE